MEKERLTVTEVLKFMRHDYLNELQLILMHLDLGNTSNARQMILNATEKIKQRTMLGRLGLPKIENWITTFEWVYNAFQTSITCNIEPGTREVDETAVVSYLDRVFTNIGKALDPVAEYTAHIDVQGSSLQWRMRIAIKGTMDQLPQLPEKEVDGFHVEETVSQHLWTFTISG